MKINVEYRRSGLQDYERLMIHLSPRARRFLQTFAMFAKNEVKRKMTESEFEFMSANNPPWAEAKGNDKVLYWTGWLASQISYRTELPARGDVIANVGFSWSNALHPTGGTITARDLIDRLVSGRTWTPTDAQRHAFYRRVPKGYEWTTRQEVYVQPARPFTDQISNDPLIYDRMHEAMDKALAVVLGDKKVKVRK